MSVGDDEEGGAVVDSLASVLVRLQFVAIDARALKALLEVVANLRAASGRVALVEVGAGDGVVGQHLALRAGADGARGRLLARVGAETGLVLALGQVAAGTLVRAVRAVRFAVAHGRQVHAAPAHAWTLPLARVASRNRWTARVTRVLVRIITAVVLSIANISLKNHSGFVKK